MYAPLHDGNSVIPRHFKNNRSMIVVDDKQEILKYQTEKERIERMTSEIDSLKSDISDIKHLLTLLLNKENPDAH
jgi:hypothetical protein